MNFGRGAPRTGSNRGGGCGRTTPRPRPSTPLNDPRQEAHSGRGSLSGGDLVIGVSLTATGDSAAAHLWQNLYVEAHGSWNDAWAEVYG